MKRHLSLVSPAGGEGQSFSDRVLEQLRTAIAVAGVTAICERLVRKGVVVRNGYHADGSRRYDLTDFGRSVLGEIPE